MVNLQSHQIVSYNLTLVTVCCSLPSFKYSTQLFLLMTLIQPVCEIHYL